MTFRGPWVATAAALAAVMTFASPAAAVPTGDIVVKHRSCEWAGRGLSTGFPNYDRLLGSTSARFWGDRAFMMVSVPLGVDENGIWHEALYAICPPANYQPPRPASR